MLAYNIKDKLYNSMNRLSNMGEALFIIIITGRLMANGIIIYPTESVILVLGPCGTTKVNSIKDFFKGKACSHLMAFE